MNDKDLAEPCPFCQKKCTRITYWHVQECESCQVEFWGHGELASQVIFSKRIKSKLYKLKIDFGAKITILSQYISASQYGGFVSLIEMSSVMENVTPSNLEEKIHYLLLFS